MGALIVFALSAAESELFLLFVVFIIPFGWVLNTDAPIHDVPVAMRFIVISGFFFGRLWRGQVGARRLLRSPVTRAALLFLCAVLAPALLLKGAWTRSSARSLYEMVSYMGFFFLILSWTDSAERMQRILRVLLYSTIVTAGFAICQEVVGGYTSLWVYLNSPGEDFAPWELRAPSFLNYSNSLAGYLNLVLPFALACYVLGKGKWKKLGAWAVGLGFIAMLSTQSIGGLVAFACVVVLAIFCFVRVWGMRLLLLGGACATAIGFYIAHETLNPSHVGVSVGYDTATRFMLWDTAWNLFVQSPIIGIGWGNFVGTYGSYISFIPADVFDVHNLYLQLLAETGIVGFAAFFVLMYRATRDAQRQLRSTRADLDRALGFGVLGAILTVLVHGNVDFLFRVSPQFSTLFWMLLALLLASAGLKGRDGPGGERVVAT